MQFWMRIGKKFSYICSYHSVFGIHRIVYLVPEKNAFAELTKRLGISHKCQTADLNRI